MRILFITVTIAAIGIGSPSFAQSDEMKLQRCIWQCLAQSKGNQDPAFHACAKKHCTSLEPPTGDTPAAKKQSGERVSPATIKFVQKRLSDLGFGPGPVDGTYGGKTAAAIRAFRKSRGLGPSGEIDDGLVEALRAENQASKQNKAPDASASANRLDVPVLEHGGDGQAANCASSVVAGLKAGGDGFLAVRSGPGTDYRQIDELHNGDVVYTYDQKGDWIGIAYDVSSIECASKTTRPIPHDKKGWVHGAWLRDLAG